MQIYLVGGAVRDKLLKIPNTDKDFVVIGSSKNEMLGLGYQQVGKGFPVFLHPKTKNEYALARIEKKIDTGYAGFECNTKNITLKQDLKRRDLTINSMAIDKNGKIIDYFDGLKDLKAGILRHTSKSFVEDPVRILRLARFTAKFAKYNFKIAQSTQKLAKLMVTNGEVNSLVAERVFTELQKTLNYQTPSNFFKTLIKYNAFERIFAIQPKKNNLSLLDNLPTKNSHIKFALWLAPYQPTEIKHICHKIKAPNKYAELAILASTWFNFADNFTKKDQQQKLNFYLKTDALRRIDRFKKLLIIFQHLNINTKTIEKIWISLKSINTKSLDKTNIITEIKQTRLKICKMD